MTLPAHVPTEYVSTRKRGVAAKRNFNSGRKPAQFEISISPVDRWHKEGCLSQVILHGDSLKRVRGEAIPQGELRRPDSLRKGTK